MRKLLFASLFVALSGGSLCAQTAKWELISADTASFLVTDGKTIVATINNGVISSPDDGAHWTHANFNVNVGSDGVQTIAFCDTTLFATTWERYYTDTWVINKSTNGAINWDSCGTLAAETFMVASKNEIIFYGGWAGGGLSRTGEDGSGWKVLDSSDFIYPWETPRLTALNDSIVAVLIDSESSERLIVSTDLGDTWQRKNIIDSGIYSLAVAGRVILMGTDSGIVRSYDLGMTWSFVSTYKNARILETKDSLILAASSTGGVILSLDYGIHWQVFNDGLPSLDITALAIGSGEIYAALYSSGIFHSTLPLLSGVSSTSATSSHSQFKMFPNPISYSANIQYLLSQNSSVTLTIFDPLGREVMQPISDEWQDAGEHDFTIDAHNLMPGIYECRLNAGDAVMTAKLVVVR